MLEILAHLFNSVVDHHGKVLNSRIGVQEILMVAEESDFVNRLNNKGDTLHKLFATHEGYGLRSSLTLETITLAIGKQIKQRGHQMPLEYAIRMVVPVVPKLGHATLKLLSIPKRSTCFTEVGLEQLGEQLASEVNAQLTIQQVPATPNVPTAPSVYGTAFTHQPSSVTSIATNDILKEFQDPSDEDDSPGSRHTSLFGSRHQTPQNAPVPPPKDTAKPPFRLALPPTPPDQKRARQGVNAPQAIDVPAAKQPRALPASAVPHTSTLSEVGWREGNSRQDFADDLRLQIQRSRVPLDFSVTRATPSVTDNGSEYTSGSTPAAKHGLRC